MDLNLSPIRNAQGSVTHWLYLNRDISTQKSTLDMLTAKEYKVVATVARNSEMPLKEIADLLHISEHTLRNHLASIYEKLGLKNRLELYVFCSKMMDDLGAVQTAPV
jgi:DNA-binding CsgD family transcriptional regulator